jgi:dihydrofolate synthase/folylpolyglutamate synthase
MAEDMIRWLYDLQHFGVKLGLDNIQAVLRMLDHPERAYRSMLIGGTNGKGSVASMTERMLAVSGLRTGLFTSPHLVRPNERIRIAGQDITDKELDRQLRYLRARIQKELGGALEAHPSFFETIAATALEAFREQGVRAAILEVGLGGRLDATNAVDADVSTVVSIDLDHTKTLGSTLAEIAAEKAGIVKPGKPVVSGVVQPAAIDVLKRVCDQRGATLIHARDRVRLVDAKADGSFSLESPLHYYQDLKVALAGRHQIDNARIAVAGFELLAETLGLTPRVDAVREGLASVRWPGRLQWVEATSDLPTLLLEGAHNAAGTATLVAYLQSLELPPPVLLFGATRGKPLTDMLEPLAPLVRNVVLTRPPVDKGIDPDDVALIARPFFDNVEVEPDPAAALKRAGELAGTDRYILATGSLYLVGEILGLLSGRTVPGPVAM